MLTAERVALNFVSRLSGIATATATLVEAVRGHKARISARARRRRLCARREIRRAGGRRRPIIALASTTPSLIKDNHVAIAGGVAEAIRRARAGVGHLVKIEVEVDTLAQLEEALAVGVDAVLLDNMIARRARARPCTMIAGRAVSEASGRVTPATAPAIAATGVDLISVGWLTHSAPVLDIGLDWQTQGQAAAA